MLAKPELANPIDDIDFPAGSTFVVAISGGSDSTALLHTLKDSIKRRALGVRLVAATVDHRLRTGSTDEAQTVAGWMREIGVEHHVLEWTGSKPSTGVQNAARAARHRLLADLADALKACAVLVGHTRNDQAETVFMRRQRGQGPGLAGIAPATLFERRVWFVRPLLQSSRDELRRWLTRRGIGWLDDPSNDNPDFERVAVRRTLAEADDRDAQLADLLALAATVWGEREAVAVQAADLIMEHARVEAPYRYRLPRAAFRVPDPGSDEGLLHTLRILLAAAGGTEQLPDLARSRSLLIGLTDVNAPRRFTLSRCVVDAQDDGIVIRRESRGKASVASDIDAGRPAPWGQFLPSFELRPAAALAHITGRALPPMLPWRIEAPQTGRRA